VEDSSTGQRLASFAQAMQLAAEVEYIPTTGRIDLNRDSLLVVCGPKTSPHTAAALAGDPRLDFATFPDGRWFLADRRTGRSITSPTDDPIDPKPADVAYLGRLARPDGNGTFLLIAGVHAVGSLGAAQYLAEHLADLYKQVGLSQFSMVIGCEYDPTTKAITNVHVETDPLLHADG